MRPTITAFERSPDGGKGLARDTRVRWALEEVGQPYDVRLVSFAAMKEPAHLALNPFGQIPTYEDANLSLFETGAIVFHIAHRHAGLLPEDSNARARAITWMFAALSTVEPLTLPPLDTDRTPPPDTVAPTSMPPRILRLPPLRTLSLSPLPPADTISLPPLLIIVPLTTAPLETFSVPATSWTSVATPPEDTLMVAEVTTRPDTEPPPETFATP